MAKEKTNKPNPTVEINNDIKNRTFRRVYLLYGSERYLIQQARDSLLKSLVPEGDTFNFSSYSQEQCKAQTIIGDITTMPFLSDYKVVLCDDSGLFRNANEELSAALESMPETSVIIFCEYEKVKAGDNNEIIKPVDARLKLYKTINKMNGAFEFTAPDDRTLLIWLKRKLSEGGKTVEDTAVYTILDAVGNDMQALSLEAEKLYSYCLDKDAITAKDAASVSSVRLKDQVFDMIDAISRHEKERALLLYQDLSQMKENVFGTLSLISRQYTILNVIHEMKKKNAPSSDIAKAAGVNPYFYPKYEKQALLYKDGSLLKCLSLCVDTDFAIKSGKLSQGAALERLIIDLLTI